MFLGRRLSLAAATAAGIVFAFVCLSAGASGTPPQALITLQADGNGLLQSSWVACASCIRRVPVGSVVTVTPTPAANYVFVSWGGECAGTAPTCVLEADGNRLVSAQFTRKQDIVTATVSGPGVISSSPPGISCGGQETQCSAAFDDGSVVTLTQAASAGTHLDQWGLDCSTSGSGDCRLPVFADAQVAADFVTPAPTPPSQPASRLYVTSHLAAALAVQSNSSPLLKCLACATELDVTNTQTVAASAPSGATITWTGGCVGAATACIIPAGQIAPVHVTSSVAFDSVSYRLTVSASSGGTVISTPSGINCSTKGGACSAYFEASQVVLRANAAQGSRFVGWGGDCKAFHRKPCQLPLPTPIGAAAGFAHGH